ncbi:MAG: hypothetical protein WCO52_00815 [bacterium]
MTPQKFTGLIASLVFLVGILVIVFAVFSTISSLLDGDSFAAQDSLLNLLGGVFLIGTGYGLATNKRWGLYLYGLLNLPLLAAALFVLSGGSDRLIGNLLNTPILVLAAIGLGCLVFLCTHRSQFN